MLLPLILASTMLQSQNLVIYKGATLEGQHLRYWDVTDTVLDSAQPDVNLGGEYAMSSGTGKVVLVKFGGLDRVAGANRKVKHARLVLSFSSLEKPVLNSIGQVLVPWGEGPILTLNAARLAAPRYDEAGKLLEVKTPPAPRWSATWRQRRAGEIGWQQSGAAGPSDVRPIEGAKLVLLNDHEFAIDGLESTFQGMIDRWYENNGFALKLDSQTEMASSQSPEGRPRLELELEPGDKKHGPDLSVVRIDQSANGEYTAHVKNVGDAPSAGFSGSWSVREKGGSSAEVAQTIEPGLEVTMTYSTPYKPNPFDHISDPVGFRIKPKGADASASNDFLEIQQGAATLDFVFDSKTAELLAGDSTSLEDWAQSQVRILNDEVLSQSRFSFAALGALERVRVGRVDIGPPVGVNSPLVADVSSDSVQVRGPVGMTPLANACEGFFLSQMGLSTGHGTYGVSLGEAKQMNGSGQARFPGLMGWGDTENDGALASQINLPYQAVFNPIFEGIRPETTDLLSASLVALINRSLGGTYKPETLTNLPKTILVRALDYNGFELKNAQLSFYQSVDRTIPDSPPAFTLATTATSATVLLPTKDAPGGQANPFGPLTNLRAAFLVKAVANESTTWAWLPAWELFDAASRGNVSASVFDLYFNAPSVPIDLEANLAKNRILTDSSNKLPAQLAALVDQDLTTTSALGNKVGDWVEIDLGRDRPIAEVSLAFKGTNFWKRFDLVTYSTGQRVDDGVVWSRELDLDWSLANRASDEGNGLRSVAYRGSAMRFRYLRLVNKLDNAGAELAEIKVFAAKPAP